MVPLLLQLTHIQTDREREREKHVWLCHCEISFVVAEEVEGRKRNNMLSKYCYLMSAMMLKRDGKPGITIMLDELNTFLIVNF